MSIRVCHPFGNANSYNAAVSFLETGRLRRFHTLIYEPWGLKKRGHPELPRCYVTTHPVRELIRLGAACLPLGRWSGRKPGFVDWVARSFDKTTAKAVVQSDQAVYCYEDSAETTFGRAQAVGAKRIYELPTPYHREKRRLFELETDREPGLAVFLDFLQEPASKLEQKDRELLAADVIVVATTFVQSSIERFLKPSARFVVVPYGSDVRVAARNWSSGDRAGPLRLFFAGVLGPGKGLHVLFAALRKLPAGSYTLTLAGRWKSGFREWLLKRYPIEYDWLGQVGHAEVYEACRRAHLFVFPSLAEGFGLVILEAMASGIPVLTTDHTAGPEIIEAGVDGWMVPAGEPEALRACLEAVMEQRDCLPQMGVAARRKAELWSWRRYRTELRAKVSKALELPVHAA